jgi:tetratricopeptide (TPR) repeat protein
VEALVPEAAERESFGRQVLAQGAGRPLFLVELCRAGADGLPHSVAELIRARLQRQPEVAQQVAQSASVLDPDFDFVTLRRASGRGEEETLDALDVLLRTGVIAEQQRNYAFAHPLVAAVIRDGLSGARRAFLYRRAAQALEMTYAGRLPLVAGRLSACYAQADDNPRAAHYAEMAGAHALQLAATAEAVNFYQRALAFEPTPSRELGLGRALYRMGNLEAGRARLVAAQRAFEARGEARGAAQASIAVCDALLRAGSFEDAIRWGKQGLALLEAEPDPETEALAHHSLGAAMLHTGRPLTDGEAHLLSAARLADANHLPEIAARARFGLGGLTAQRGDLAGAVQRFEEAVALSAAAGDQFHEIIGHNNAAYHAALLGDLTAAHSHIEAGLALAEARALPVTHQWLFSTRGEIALAENDWAAAEDWLTRGLAAAERYGNAEMAATYRANLGLAARGRGDGERALALLAEARALVANSPEQIKIDLWLGETHLALGAPEMAREALCRAEAGLIKFGERGRLRAWAERLREQLT